MSERGHDSLDDRIDAALRAMVAADDRPVDLRVAISQPRTTRSSPAGSGGVFYFPPQLGRARMVRHGLQ